MKMPAGYDEWRLNPPGADDLQCAWCGGWRDLRIEAAGCWPRWPPEITCEGCFVGADDGPCFDDLPEAEGYMAEQAAEREDERGDYLYQQWKDRDK